MTAEGRHGLLRRFDVQTGRVILFVPKLNLLFYTAAQLTPIPSTICPHECSASDIHLLLASCRPFVKNAEARLGLLPDWKWIMRKSIIFCNVATKTGVWSSDGTEQVKFKWILYVFEVVEVCTDQFWIVILSWKNFGTLHYSPRVSPKAVNHCSLCCQSSSCIILIDWIFL